MMEAASKVVGANVLVSTLSFKNNWQVKVMYIYKPQCDVFIYTYIIETLNQNN